MTEKEAYLITLGKAQMATEVKTLIKSVIDKLDECIHDEDQLGFVFEVQNMLSKLQQTTINLGDEARTLYIIIEGGK